MLLRILLLLLLVLVVVLWWKHQQRGKVQRDSAAPPPPANPETMVRCAECGLHLPQSQALPGKGGSYCSAEHRASHEARS